jgi:hypothetical protein
MIIVAQIRQSRFQVGDEVRGELVAGERIATECFVEY